MKIPKKSTLVNNCATFPQTMQHFNIGKENDLCLVIDNASNLTNLYEDELEADPDTSEDVPGHKFEYFVT